MKRAHLSENVFRVVSYLKPALAGLIEMRWRVDKQRIEVVRETKTCWLIKDTPVNLALVLAWLARRKTYENLIAAILERHVTVSVRALTRYIDDNNINLVAFRLVHC